MATIKAIEGHSVHQIQSGQVIVDLCSVVKELVENSLDAGATSIDVRFKAQGLDAIEVQDNGWGISKADYDTLGMKHYTSKLSSYDDLASLSTFGFRGEALSSLCALSRLSVVTAQDGEAPKGIKLEYETSGQLGQTSIAAAQKGTLVCAESLFHNLPVRRRELERNIKREYGKVLNILNAYACICTGVKLSVSNQATKGKKVVVFATKNNATTKENIANVYGVKTIPALIPLKLKFELEPSLPSQALPGFQSQSDSFKRDVQVVGHMSRPAHGEGRQTPDRQMFFVNSRPCGLPQIAKAFNEVYKTYNVTQSPFIFADLKIDTNAYDVNVSPDKRTIMLHDQPRLIEAIKRALFELFETQDQTIPLSQRPQARLPGFKPLSVNRGASIALQPRSDTPAIDMPNSSTILTQSTNASSTIKSLDISSAGGPIADLTAQFVGRNVESRRDEPKAANQAGRPSRDKQRMASRFLNEAAIPELDDDTAVEASTTTEDASAQAEIAQDPRNHPASQEATHTQRQMETVGAPDNAKSMQEEEPIPSTNTSSSKRGSPGVVAAAYSQMRPTRTPMEIATITIGSNTTTKVIGSQGGAKRRCLSPSVEKHDRRSSAQTPRFSQGLRAFAAPGTQVQEDDVDALSQQSGSPAQHVQFSERDDDGSDVHSRAYSQDSPTSEDSSQSQLDEPGVKRGSKESSNIDETRNDGGSDDEYVDEAESKARAEAHTQQLVQEAEQAAAAPTQSSLKRATNVLKRSSEAKVNLARSIHLHLDDLRRQALDLGRGDLAERRTAATDKATAYNAAKPAVDITQEDPESRLSLTISKSDFASMRVVGQFNLGFILAVRPSSPPHNTMPPANQSSSLRPPAADDLFIIDQHASDEIYNFHRLSASTHLTPQRLVHPQQLSLTAVEEETIITHAPHSLLLNGFEVSVDESGDSAVGQRCRLLSLPTSKDTVFSASDLEELLVLLADDNAAAATTITTDNNRSKHQSKCSIIRPSKVRKMLAMRACRSSIMVGRALTQVQMRRVVRHMGEMERPWNCPHGRPTMRHLAGIGETTAGFGAGAGAGSVNGGWSSWREDGDGAWGHQAFGSDDDDDDDYDDKGEDEIHEDGDGEAEDTSVRKRLQSRTRGKKQQRRWKGWAAWLDGLRRGDPHSHSHSHSEDEGDANQGDEEEAESTAEGEHVISEEYIDDGAGDAIVADDDDGNDGLDDADDDDDDDDAGDFEMDDGDQDPKEDDEEAERREEEEEEEEEEPPPPRRSINLSSFRNTAS